MLDDNFDFLKVKPMPKNKQDFNFFINKLPGQPNIIDKTKDKNIDVNDFLYKIKTKLDIQTNFISKQPPISKKDPIPQI